MAVFKLKRDYTFSETQISGVLNYLKIRGRIRRQWLKRLSKVDIGSCVYEAIDQLQEPLWIGSDELERTLLRDFVGRYSLTYMVIHYQVDDDIQGLLREAFLKDLSDYMACLSSEKTLYRYIWTKRSIKFKNKCRLNAHDEEVRYWFLKDYRRLTMAFDRVKQYRVLVVHLLYQAGLKGDFEEILSAGFLKLNLFENDFLAYEKQMGEGINRPWAYGLLTKFILKGELLNRERIFKCLSAYSYVRTGKLEDTIQRLFYFNEKRSVPLGIHRPEKGDQVRKQGMAAYFKNMGQQVLLEIGGIQDETTYVLYRWMYQVNPWRFFMFCQLLKKLHISLADPSLKDLQVFIFLMDKLCRWERVLNRDLVDQFEAHMAVTYYEEMKAWESHLYLEDVLITLANEGAME